MKTERVDVLDHGFVELIDVMGDDQAIVDAARVSIAGENVKAKTGNAALIRYLYRNRHTTPFEMVEFKFRAAMPIFVARQWVRHRTANINEMSARYSEIPEQFYVPDTEQMKQQAQVNKQGRSDETIEDPNFHRLRLKDAAEYGFRIYRSALAAGTARELARVCLPLSAYTEWIWKIDLHNLFHFLSLRMNPHAQYEIRVYADAMAHLISSHVPIACQAFKDYRLNAVMLTAQDAAACKVLTTHLPGGNRNELLRECFPTKREATEFAHKAPKITGHSVEELLAIFEAKR